MNSVLELWFTPTVALLLEIVVPKTVPLTFAVLLSDLW
jgi:hypothetical protein